MQRAALTLRHNTMGLSRQSLSPAAKLLRNSRLFSLPNPLPRPEIGDTSGGSIIRVSDTATLPYPTHQAITTTPSSLARGDWGLKRPLPTKSSLLKVSDPVVRITQLDSIEHVTDFDSAADHVRTREKWQEMGVPMMKGLAQMRTVDMSGTDALGAFEGRDDITSYESDRGLDEASLFFKELTKNVERNWARDKERRALEEELEAAKHLLNRRAKQVRGKINAEWRVQDAEKALMEFEKGDSMAYKPLVKPQASADAHNTKRWKHDGPWLPGMSAAEFVVYLKTEVAKRREEFNKYLIEFVKSEIYAARQQAAKSSGVPEDVPEDVDEAAAWQNSREKAWSTFTDEEINANIRALRREAANRILTSRLVEKLIMPFLKIPSVKFKFKSWADDATKSDIEQFRVDEDANPLSTHPSAGLGYLRTKSYLTTHPILGPQANPAPIAARVIQPRTTSTGKESTARLGVGGFVADDSLRSTDMSTNMRVNISNAQDVETIDIHIPGGKKVPVHPLFGSIANNGRLMIKLTRATGQESLVAKGYLDDRPPVDFDSIEKMGETGGEGEDSARANELKRVLAAAVAAGGQ